VQRNLPGNFVVTLAYAGNEGVHLMVNEQLNQFSTSDEALGAGLNTLLPNPLYGLIDPASSIDTPTVKQSQLICPFPQFQNFEANNVGIGHSSYNAGQLTVEHRLNYGLALLFAYTYSKAIDNVGEQTSVAGTMGALTNTYCPSCDRSRSKGSITPGKLADFVVLRKDPRKVPPDSIKDSLSKRPIWAATRSMPRLPSLYPCCRLWTTETETRTPIRIKPVPLDLIGLEFLMRQVCCFMFPVVLRT
jgi:hypothetical protein